MPDKHGEPTARAKVASVGISIRYPKSWFPLPLTEDEYKAQHLWLAEKLTTATHICCPNIRRSFRRRQCFAWADFATIVQTGAEPHVFVEAYPPSCEPMLSSGP